MRRSLTLLLLIGTFAWGWGQTPGILGRKLVVAATGQVALSLGWMPNTYTYQFKDKLGYLVPIPGLRIERAMSRRTSLAVVGGLTLSAEATGGPVSLLYFQNRTIGTGIRIKHYGFLRKGNLAPVGGFVEYGLNMQLCEHRWLEGPWPSEVRSKRWVVVAPRPSLGFGHAWLWRRVWGEMGMVFMLPISNAPNTGGRDEYPLRQQFVNVRMGLGWLM